MCTVRTQPTRKNTMIIEPPHRVIPPLLIIILKRNAVCCFLLQFRDFRLSSVSIASELVTLVLKKNKSQRTVCGWFKRENERSATTSKIRESVVRFTACFPLSRLLPPCVHALPTAYYVVGKITRYILHNGSSARTDYGLWQLRLIARPTNQQPWVCFMYVE